MGDALEITFDWNKDPYTDERGQQTWRGENVELPDCELVVFVKTYPAYPNGLAWAWEAEAHRYFTGPAEHRRQAKKAPYEKLIKEAEARGEGDSRRTDRLHARLAGICAECDEMDDYWTDPHVTVEATQRGYVRTREEAVALAEGTARTLYRRVAALTSLPGITNDSGMALPASKPRTRKHVAAAAA